MGDETGNEEPETPSLKLKIKLPGLATPPVQQPLSYSHQRPQTMPHWGQGASPKLPKHTSKLNKSLANKSLNKSVKKTKSQKRKKGSGSLKNNPAGTSLMSKKMRLTLNPGNTSANSAKNRQKKPETPSDSSDYDSDSLAMSGGYLKIDQKHLNNPSYYMNGHSAAGSSQQSGLVAPSGNTSATPAFAPMAGGIGALPMQVVTDNKLYCVCQSPHDDVSEMIGCDAPDCRIEWFHFECVGIMVAPEGQWYCPECTKRYNIRPNTI